MATENTSTPSGTGPLTVHGAAEAFASLLSVEDDGTQLGGEAEQANKPDEGEDAEEQEASEGSEHEDEEGSESEAEDEGDGEGQELRDDTKVKVGDEEVTLHELKRGFLREQDYTRKTQALANDRKQFEQTANTEISTLRGERAQLAQALGQVQTFMQELLPKEPDWNALYAQNPGEYAAQRELWRSWQEQLQGVSAKQRSLMEAEQQQNFQQLQQQLQSESERLLEALPEWKKPEVKKAERQRLIDWGQKNGFSEQELLSVVDHRALLTARKAMLYDEMMSKKQQLRPVPSKGPKTATPGTAGTKPARATDLTRSKQRLAQTGRVSDAAAVFEQLLGED